jgi:hypothetical protein
MSTWYYSTVGQQLGPVDDTALDKLISDGVVDGNTFVWRDGMTDWKPLSQARPGKATSDAATCSVCGKAVGAENLIELLGNRVCAECKPMAVQSLKEGAFIPSKQTAWCEGNKVVAHSQTSLPARCFKCNKEVTTAPLNRNLYWHPPLYYLFIFFNIIVYAVIAMIVRKRATLDVYLCEQHTQRRKYFIIGGWAGSLLGIILVIVGAVENMGWLSFVGIAVFVGAIIAGVAGAQLARPSRIKGDLVWLGGAGKEFRASLPPMP